MKIVKLDAHSRSQAGPEVRAWVVLEVDFQPLAAIPSTVEYVKPLTSTFFADEKFHKKGKIL